MKKTLNDVAKLFSGQPEKAFSRVPFENAKQVYLLQGNDILKTGFVNDKLLTKVYIIDLKRYEKNKLMAGDVVFLCRGSGLRAAYITKDIANKNIIAGANFIVIRPNKSIKGEVITAFLNIKSIIGFKVRVLSLSTYHVSLKSIKKIFIPDLNIDTQNAICDLFYSAHKELVSGIERINKEYEQKYFHLNELLSEISY